LKRDAFAAEIQLDPPHGAARLTRIHMTHATRPAFDLQAVQRRRKWAALAAGLGLVSLALFNQTGDGVHGALHESIEILGRAAIIVAIVGRAWCSLYIGGRKKAEIVDRGPYSISRNPLYMFSFIGAFGVGSQTGSVVIGALFVLAAFIVFAVTVEREEAWLKNRFGEEYEAYRKRTPRFLPNFTKWRDTDELTIRPAFFALTIRDGLVFLLAIPLFELIDVGQSAHWLKVVLHLP
jgi:protein-S-isoprenylcysteine O-methyltransferase Ste14